MLFNSYPFLFLFLPVTLIAFHLLRRWSWTWAITTASIMSLVFYASWNWRYLALLVPSLIANFWLGEAISRTRQRRWLYLGVAGNLAVIGWFKYSLFLYVAATGSSEPPQFLRDIALPLGISFITFQKIAYLVDTWRGHPTAQSFGRFAFFVLFFPQLIAGPIVLFRNFDRQVAKGPRRDAFYRTAAFYGLILFAIGLFKKVVFADSVGYFADQLYAWAAYADFLRRSDAILAILAYGLQLYFDFSAYSDMAIGLGWMFGLRLPTNFNSPYQATSIIDFWRRWHITLSSFFREYVYIPLGGNRRGIALQSVFILAVFLLTGLWHGAGWTFIAWGVLHGLLVLVNHLWARWSPRRLPDVVTWPLTLGSVFLLWVIFRAPNWSVAWKILSVLPRDPYSFAGRAFAFDVLLYVPLVLLILLLGAIALALPNSRLLARKLRIGFARRPLQVHPQYRGASWIAAAVTGAALYLAISSIGSIQTKFIYFNF